MARQRAGRLGPRCIGGAAARQTFEVRLATSDLALLCQDPVSWIGRDNQAKAPAVGTEESVEYLPPWTPAAHAAAAADVEQALLAAGCALGHVGVAHNHGDAIGIATALERARGLLTSAALILGRHDPAVHTTALVGRYLPPEHAAALTRSRSADPGAPDGLASSCAALLELLGALCHACRHHLGHPAPRPLETAAAALAAILGPDRPPPREAPLHQATLYDEDLASCYDTARPMPVAMRDGLRRLAATELARADAAEIGAGTGRITLQLAPATRSYHAVECSAAMHARLLARCAENPALPITAHLADACQLPLPANSVDAIVEHEALLFTPHPVRAVGEAMRALRPGGRIIRIVVHADHDDPVHVVHRAYRAAAANVGEPALICGKGTDQLLTAHLAGHGLTTTETTLAHWTQPLTMEEILKPLRAAALPFIRPMSTRARDTALRLRACW
jgi:ubiquinone/menaquinone biosynthesis C-methylase UbiE